MDWLTFVLGIFKAAIWPAVVLTAMLVFRRQTASLLVHFGRRRITLKGGGGEVTVSEELSGIEDKAPAPPKNIAIGKAVFQAPTVAAEIQQYSIAEVIRADLPPDYIIAQAWLRVVEELRLALSARGVDTTGRGSGSVVILSRAHKEGLLTGPEFQELQDLRQLRNKVLHEPDATVSLTDALRFKNLADGLIERLRDKRLPPLPPFTTAIPEAQP